MRWNRKRRLRWIVALCCAGLATGGTYVYTNQNTVPQSYAGTGAAAINGYTVSSGPTYTLDANDPQTIASVSFTLSNAASAVPSSVEVQLSPGGTWYSCPASLTPTCTTTGEATTGASSFTVVAVK